MIVTLKTFLCKTFKIVIDESQTVLDLKDKIEETQGSSFPASALKLVYSGKVLNNDSPISEYKIRENQFIVVMVSKTRSKSSEVSNRGTSGAREIAPTDLTSLQASGTVRETTSPQTTGNSATATTGSATTVLPREIRSLVRNNTEAISSALSNQSASVNSEAGNEASGSILSDTNTTMLPVDNESERVVEELVSMGFGRDQAIQALHVNFNNPNRAAEYLVQQQSSQEPNVGLSQIPHSQIGSIESNSLPIYQGERSQNTGREDLIAAFHTPELILMLQHVRENPNHLPVFMATIQETHPNLFSLIRDNHQAFIQLYEASPMHQSGVSNREGSSSTFRQSGTPNHHHITITPEEKEAIERLKALGFSEVMVLQAFLACDKDEHQAADFLFSENVDH